MSNDTQPEIRFPGFTEDWEERKLSDIADKAVDNRGKTPTISEDGNHPLLEVASLGNGAPDYSKVTKYLSDETFMAELRAYIREGDILFSTVGSIGLVSLMDTNENAAIAQNIVAFRANEKYDSKFLYAMLSTKDNQHKAQRIVMGAVQPSIKVSQLVDVDYCVTENMEEQRKLGEYFLNLDNLITLHQRKLDLLKETKKGFLQKMFPKNGAKVPEIRFPGFTEDWEERKLVDIFKKDTQKNKDLEFHSDSVISVAKMKLSPPSAKSSDEYMKTYNKIRKGNVAFEGHTNDEFPNGRFVLNDCQDGIVSHIYDVYSAVDEYNNEFMKRYINNPDVMRKILINATSSARMMKSLNSIEFLKQSILLPILSEQQKIGKFFYQLDNTITLHQRKLDLLKETKKGFLQKMFV